MRAAIPLLGVVAFVGLFGGCAHWRLIEEGEPNPRALERLERDTAYARGLPFLRPVEADVLDDEEVRGYFEQRFSGSDEWYDVHTKVAHKLGILPGHVHLSDLYKNAYAKNAAALYEREAGGRMLLFEEAFPLVVRWPLEVINLLTATDWLNELIVSHELVHALQDQHFDLGKVLPPALYGENEDAALAHKSVVESEANLVSYAHVFRADLDSWLMRNLLLEYLLGTSWLTIALALVTNQGSPSFYTKVLTLQYFHGMRFLQFAANEGGGFDGVTRAYLTGLPDSTEQLLWPKKLTAEAWDPPKRLATLDESALAGWTLLDENTFGELALRTLFELFMPARRAEGAAKGWGGDRYIVVEKEGRVLLAWRFLLDSDEDARELEDAYRRVIQGKYQGRVARRAKRGAHDDDGWTLWRIEPSLEGEQRNKAGVPTTLPELIAMRREGARVVVLEGLAPETWRDDAESVWRATRADEGDVPRAPTSLAARADVVMPARAERPDSGVMRMLLLDHHEMEMRFGLGALVDESGALYLARESHLRWGFRPNLELSLPLALSYGDRFGFTALVVSAGVPAAIEDPGLIGLSVTGALLFTSRLALVAQGRAQADPVGFVPWREGAFVGVALGAYGKVLDRAMLAASVGYEREAVMVSGGRQVTERVVLGSATRRGFVEQPVVELRLIDQVHAWASYRLELETRSFTAGEQRFALGLSLYF